MVNPNRQIAGRKAQSSGLAFEKIFRRQAQLERVHIERMPDGCRTIPPKKLVRVETPYDFILALDGSSAFIDTKTFDGERLYYSDITPHQLESLYSMGWHNPAGYVVWFRTTNQVVFFSWRIMIDIKPESSVGLRDGLWLGNITNFSVKPILLSYKPGTYGDRSLMDFKFWGR